MFYLKAKKIDITSGSRKYVIVNSKTAVDEGIDGDARLQLSIPKTEKKPIIVDVDITEKVISAHHVGLDPETWDDLGLEEGSLICLEFVSPPESLNAIRKKLLGNSLKYKEIKGVLNDIVSQKLGDIEASYFAACGFNPGFSDTELFYLTKAMAESGKTIKWPYEKVIDKHSIGGLAGKGITPIIVSIIASKGLVIPNTSTRSITSPAGTTDVLEVFTDMEYTLDEIQELIRKNNACFVWGGGLDMAPADEALIRIEKPIGIELYDKFIVSILAKKVAMGLTHYVLDIPSGPDTKVVKAQDVQIIREKFETLSEKFGIKVKVLTRTALGPDGRGVGPALEAIDFLKVLLQDEDCYIPLEDISLHLAGELLELAEEAEPGKGYKEAEKQLKSGAAYKKFRQLIEAQGGNPNIRPDEIKLGEHTYDIIASKSGMVMDMDNKVIKEVSHSLGTPTVRQAGLFLHKHIGEKYKKGDKLITLYATSETRLELSKKILEIKNIIID